MSNPPQSRMIIWIHKLVDSGIDVMLQLYQPDRSVYVGHRCLVPVQAHFDHGQLSAAREWARTNAVYDGVSYPVEEVGGWSR